MSPTENESGAELIAERLIATYERKGYTREWINQRLQAISARKELTDEWKDRGVSNVARMALEEETGVPVITSQNAIQLNRVVEAMIAASALIADDETEK